jgi:hypothetical protein
MAAYGAYGTVLKRGATTIAQVVNIDGPSMKKETIDTTHLTTTNRWRTHISSLRDGGEVTFELFFDPVDSGHEALEDDFAGDAAPTTFSIVWSDAAPTTWSFAAMVVEISPKAPLGEALKGSYKLKVSGPVTTD